MEPIQVFFGILFGAIIGSNQTSLPTCDEVAKSNPSVYQLQHGGWGTSGHTGARPMKTCRMAGK